MMSGMQNRVGQRPYRERNPSTAPHSRYPVLVVSIWHSRMVTPTILSGDAAR